MAESMTECLVIELGAVVHWKQIDSAKIRSDRVLLRTLAPVKAQLPRQALCPYISDAIAPKIQRTPAHLALTPLHPDQALRAPLGEGADCLRQGFHSPFTAVASSSCLSSS